TQSWNVTTLEARCSVKTDAQGNLIRPDVHDDSQGRDVGARLQAFGYSAANGENIWHGGAGYVDSADQALNRWQNSDGHNRNMLDPKWTATGVSRTCTAAGCAWVNDFGTQVVQAAGAAAGGGAPAGAGRPVTREFPLRVDCRNLNRACDTVLPTEVTVTTRDQLRARVA